jgi:MerR family transcriptional regulator, light-induced transcriptional regulator
MTITRGNNRKFDLYNPFLEALLLGNKQSGSDYVHKLLKQGMAFPEVYEQVIKQALYRVGELWEHNKISVAEEHLATSISEAIMNEMFSAIISPHRCSKKVLVGCVEQEQHQVGAKMVADMFESKGWDSYYLGANIPVTGLIDFARKLKPDMIALSATIYFHIPLLKK